MRRLWCRLFGHDWRYWQQAGRVGDPASGAGWSGVITGTRCMRCHRWWQEGWPKR